MTLFLKKVQHLPVDGRATARHIPWRRFEQASVDAFSRIALPGVLIGTFVRFRDVVSEFRHASRVTRLSRFSTTYVAVHAAQNIILLLYYIPVYTKLDWTKHTGAPHKWQSTWE